MIELYHFYGATCGLKARLAVAEKGIAVQDRAVDRAYLVTPEYRALNPNGVVPTLVHDGQVLTESTVIINYLDDIAPERPLKTGTPLGAARALWWMKRADDHLPYFGNLTYTVSKRPDLLALGAEGFQAYLDAIPERHVRERRRRIVDLGFENPDFTIAMDGIKSTLAAMDATLASSPWLAGDAFSLGDIAVIPLIERLNELTFTGFFDRLGHVGAWWDRVRQRASYDACVVQHPNPEAIAYGERGRDAWPDISKLL